MSGKITLLNVDCMDYMKDCEDNAFSLAICDPPYGININSSGRLGHYGGKKEWDKSIPNGKYFSEIKRVSINRIIWGGNYFGLPPTRGFIIWDKQQPEDISFASCEYAWTNFDRVAKTFYMRPQSADFIRIHPAQKPKALYEWLLTNYAKPGDRIIDTHGGSMSSAIAAHYGGFDMVLCEIDKDYYDAGCKRFKDETKQLDLLK